MNTWFLALLFLAGPLGPELHAQSAAGGPRRQAVFQLPVQPVDTPSVAIKQTQWKKGAVIGGIALGVPALAFGLGLCGDTDSGGGQGVGCVVGGTLVGMLAGAAIGALIGGQFPKQPQAQPSAPGPAT